MGRLVGGHDPVSPLLAGGGLSSLPAGPEHGAEARSPCRHYRLTSMGNDPNHLRCGGPRGPGRRGLRLSAAAVTAEGGGLPPPPGLGVPAGGLSKLWGFHMLCDYEKRVPSETGGRGSQCMRSFLTLASSSVHALSSLAPRCYLRAPLAPHCPHTPPLPPALHQHHGAMFQPPSATITWPLRYRDASAARNSTAFAMSSGCTTSRDVSAMAIGKAIAGPLES